MKEIQPPRTLSELVYDALVDGICDGSLAPDARLTQDEVAERLNVSRLPVGQALARLKAEGFVCEAGRRGLKVAPLAPEFVREIFEIRAGIEQMAAGLAARRAGSEARERGQALLAAGRRAADSQDMAALIRLDMEFHQFVYALSGNSLIEDAMSTHWQHLRRAMRHSLGERRNQEQVWREHAGVVEAICAGDAVAAERAMREHVEHSAEFYEAAIAGQRAAG